MRFPSGFLDLILPPVCLACDRLIAAGDEKRLVCRRCRTLLRSPPPPICLRCGAPRLRTGRTVDVEACEECQAWPTELRRAVSAFVMHTPADRIVHQLKYRGWAALGTVMGEAVARALLASDLVRDVTVVMPVPTTGSRIRERGYNQAELIARAVARALGRDCELLLQRTAASSTQTTLQPAARGANVAGAFTLRCGMRAQVERAHVLIVDDVLTTGATVIECTNTLVAGGARCTSVATYARALDARRLLG